MAANASWAFEAPATNLGVNETSPAKTVLDIAELRGSGLPGIIGNSAAFRRVLRLTRVVAPTGATMLILGETGTGKELIARAIHEQSARCQGPYIKVNCAAIPAGLLESELFGHERGAFTAASTQTNGRFQLANQGTMFLDEIADLPLELQPKLLRVLQEQEFERVGSTRTIRVNVRVVAAANLDLAEMVRERRFRADLFYRLNVFPISLPPLRERSEDIPELVGHFVRVFAHRMNKEITEISDEVMEVIRAHTWPGNIRELENFIERAAVMSPGPVLRPPCGDLKLLVQHDVPSTIRTLAQAEREHILDVLSRVGWIVGGRDGAAARLGLPRTTLLYRMRKLGVKPARAPGRRTQTDVGAQELQPRLANAAKDLLHGHSKEQANAFFSLRTAESLDRTAPVRAKA